MSSDAQGAAESAELLDLENFRQWLEDDSTFDWAADNIPIFDAEDADLVTAYYYRWRVYKYACRLGPRFGCSPVLYCWVCPVRVVLFS